MGYNRRKWKPLIGSNKLAPCHRVLNMIATRSENYDQSRNASIVVHNHPLFLPTVLYVGSVPVNEHRLVRVGHFKHHRPCYKLVKELTAQRLWE